MQAMAILLMFFCASGDHEQARPAEPAQTFREAAKTPKSHERGKPILYKKLGIPEKLLITTADDNGNMQTFGGDLRIGDLDGDGAINFLVYRNVDGTKPAFMGVFNLDGKVLWKAGADGGQPIRPGPVALHDIDGDGGSEVICLFHRPGSEL